MSTYTGQIDRGRAAEYGGEAVAIGECGHYRAPSGLSVDIKELLSSAANGTVSYPSDSPISGANAGQYDTIVEVVNETTLSAGKRLMEAGCHPVLLNFASATNPGGGFLNGARAQEEYLARSSCLYACIRSNAMYTFHRANYDPLYTDYAIYSPGVPVIRADNGTLLESPYTIAMITCAAANASRLPAERRHEIGLAMMRRICKVLSVGIAHSHDGIVLGAWGCGAFGNDGQEIAGLFHDALSNKFKGTYRRVIFAVVDWSPDRRFIGPFEKQFQSNAQSGAPLAWKRMIPETNNEE
jgi:uncharacterized protein (TIGR02452 family)